MRFGLLTVFAVSGSMVLLVHQVHKHSLNSFMKKFELEIRGVLYPHDQKVLGGTKKHQTKKVRFAEDVLELPMENKWDRINVAMAQQVEDKKVLIMEEVEKRKCGQKLNDIMPPNREVLYRGIMKYRALKGGLDF